MAKSASEALLSEIAKRLRSICCNTASTGGTIVQNYQPLDCNGDPVGTPIDVMAMISVAKMDTSICNYQQVADAIAGTYNVPNMGIVPSAGSTKALIADFLVDVTKLHSISIVIIGTTGTVSMTGTLGGGTQTYATLPVGFSTNFVASTVFGTGDISWTTTGDATVIVSTLSTL